MSIEKARLSVTEIGEMYKRHLSTMDFIKTPWPNYKGYWEKRYTKEEKSKCHSADKK